MTYCLAIDIGASSGRHIVGWLENGEIMTREVYRFLNGMESRDGHLIWDMEVLLSHVVKTPSFLLKSSAGKLRMR